MATVDDLNEIMDALIADAKNSLREGNLDARKFKEIREFLKDQGVQIMPRNAKPLEQLKREAKRLPFGNFDLSFDDDDADKEMVKQ